MKKELQNLTKTVSENIAKSKNTSILIAGIGAVGAAALSAIITKAHSSKVDTEINELKEAISSRDDEYQDLLKNMSDQISRQNDERSDILKEINENIKKQSEIFDRINFCFEEQDLYYSEQDQEDNDIPEEEPQENNNIPNGEPAPEKDPN